MSEESLRNRSEALEQELKEAEQNFSDEKQRSLALLTKIETLNKEFANHRLKAQELLIEKDEET